MATIGVEAIAWLLTTLALAQANQGPPPERTFRWGLRPVDAITEHFAEGGLRGPSGVFFDTRTDEVVIADSKNGLIGIFDRDGVPLFSFGGEGVINDPRSIAVGADGAIYVLASDGRMLLAYNYRGEAQQPLRFVYPALEDSPPGVARIGAFALGADGRWYVGDLERPQVLVYDSALELERVIRPQRAGARFDTIVGLAVSSAGLIAVIDAVETPVQIFDRDGRFLVGFGKRDLGIENFVAPMEAEFDADGYLYVVDLLRHDVKIFDQKGRFQSLFGGWYSPQTRGRTAGELLYPSDIAIAPDGRVYVAERVGERIQIFERVERPGPRPAGQGAAQGPPGGG